MDTSSDLVERELGVTTTPRSTWVWARNADECDAARAAIDAAGGLARWRQAYRGGEPVRNVSDIDIGVDALEAELALEAAGFTLRPITDPDRAGTWF